MFKFLEEKELNILVDAMHEKETKVGDIIIKENDDGNDLYVVEEGNFECFKAIDNKEELIKTYQKGEYFGELALLYNTPR